VWLLQPSSNFSPQLQLPAPFDKTARHFARDLHLQPFELFDVFRVVAAGADRSLMPDSGDDPFLKFAGENTLG
jgi:hypothetical protein